LEIVEDRETKTPFDPSLNIAARFKKTAFAEGLVCYPMAGTRDGREGDHIMLAPPFIMTDEQIDEIIGYLRISLDKVLAS
jgi:adenosylmethionine-8-amino-7-oxononanoate aminotransferase